MTQSSPLRHTQYRRFYIGTASVTFGYVMQATSAAWLMTTLSTSPFMVALVQTASTVPTLLLGLVAGALADIFDRRHILIASQMLLFLASALLGIATLAGVIGPSSLLILTFMTGVGFAFAGPALQAMLVDLVPPDELAPAVSLGSVAANVSRATAPAFAGGIAILFGSGFVFLVSAIFQGGIVFAIGARQTTAKPFVSSGESIVSGIKGGLRFIRHSPPSLAFVVRSFIFCLFGGNFLALLPIVARDQLGMGAGGYGVLYGCFGAGAILSVFTVSKLVQYIPLNSRINGAMMAFATAAAVVGNTSNIGVALGGAVVAGMAWVIILADLFSGALSWSPAWVRARIVATNLLAVQAGLAFGSGIWGWLASHTSTGTASGISFFGMALALAATYRMRLVFGEQANVTTEVHLPGLTIAVEPHVDDGPVLIQCAYQINPEKEAAFLQNVLALERVRRRNGASSWKVFRDLEHEGSFIERFIVPSWGEYTRLRERFTVVDHELRERVTEYQVPGVPIRVSRLIALGKD